MLHHNNYYCHGNSTSAFWLLEVYNYHIQLTIEIIRKRTSRYVIEESSENIAAF